jgi:hypothetical protein
MTDSHILPFLSEDKRNGGVRLEKYLLDHFAVRGAIYSVKPMPAMKERAGKLSRPNLPSQGGDPLCRYFGALEQYNGRMRDLLGRRIETAAAKQHAEKERTDEGLPGGAQLTPENDLVRLAHYPGSPELYYLFNESACRYDGVISLPQKKCLHEYDAWGGRALMLDYWNHGEKSYVSVSIESGKSVLVICDEPGKSPLYEHLDLSGDKAELRDFRRSFCKCAGYPAFSFRRRISKPESYSIKHKRLPCVVRYEAAFSLESFRQVALEITNAYEVVEVFVNGRSAGIQVVPSFVFDLTELCRSGGNTLAIEVAATFEHERGSKKKAPPTGITGSVCLYVQ